MKKTFASILTALAFAFSVNAAETTAKISNVHLCCQSCVKGVEKAVSNVSGVTTTVDKDAETVTLNGPDKASVQKAADAIVAAGYFGKSSDVKIASDSGATGKKVKSATVEGVHLCCGKCVSAVDKALKTVPGVTGNTAKKGADSFDVTGDFNDKDVANALQKAGLSGKIAK